MADEWHSIQQIPRGMTLACLYYKELVKGHQYKLEVTDSRGKIIQSLKSPEGASLTRNFHQWENRWSLTGLVKMLTQGLRVIYFSRRIEKLGFPEVYYHR